MLAVLAMTICRIDFNQNTINAIFMIFHVKGREGGKVSDA